MSIAINGGAPLTYTRDVTLTLGAPAWTSPAEMRLRNEGAAWGAWQAYRESLSWTLSDGYGAKTVGVEFRRTGGASAPGESAQVSYVIANVTGTWLIIKTPDYSDDAGEQTSYLRLGAPDVGPENVLLDSHEGVGNKGELRDTSSAHNTFPGWFEYTDGDRTLVARGDNRVSIQRNESVTIGGDKSDRVAGKYEVKAGTSETFTFGDADKFTHGADESYFAGYKLDASFGINASVSLGGEFGLKVGIGVDCFFGYKIELGASRNFSFILGDELRVVRKQEQEARESIHLHVTPHGSTSTRVKSLLALHSKPLALVAGVGAAAFAGAAGPMSDQEPTAVTGALGGAAAFATCMAASLYVALQATKERREPLAELEMDKDGVRLKTKKGSALSVRPDGAILNGNRLLLTTDKASMDLDRTGKLELNAGKMELGARGGMQLNAPKVIIGGVLTIEGRASAPRPPPPPPPRPPTAVDMAMV